MDPEALQRSCDEALVWPLPGHGDTLTRWEHLIDLARRDLVLARLVEAHADAVAILAELHAPPTAPGQRWGVWAAGPPDAVRAELDGERWVLHGTKPWCSGAGLLTHALVTAAVPGGQLLLAAGLAQPSVRAEPSQWANAGMSGSDTRSVTFEATPALAVGAVGDYLARLGFWIGAIGVAACWLGGAQSAALVLRAKARTSEDPHLLAHLGAVHTSLTQAAALLERAARDVDAAPHGDHAVLARTVRGAVERCATEVLDRVGRATGPAPLAHDATHAGLVADLTIYVRQHHAERDLEALGRDLVKGDVGA